MMSITIRKELLFMIAAIVVAVYVLIKWRRGASKEEKILGVKELIHITFCLYAIALVGVTLFPIVIPPNSEPYMMNYVNWDIRNICNYGDMRSLVANIAGNILMFIPLMPLIRLTWPQKKVSLTKAGIISLGVSSVIEGLQYLENIFAISDFPIRITDISDLALNFIGGIFGYGHFEFWRKHIK
ncbi:VanZ family protein [Ihubacter sp. rT4E-8]|uniref:VanZ family protein n=1 Tax=Ihubacter sp. rT4E-8 TaxID=3242369 RepID=UPI003CEBAA59